MNRKPRKVVADPRWHRCRTPFLWWTFIQPLGLLWTCKECNKTWRKEPDSWGDITWKKYAPDK